MKNRIAVVAMVLVLSACAITLPLPQSESTSQAQRTDPRGATTAPPVAPSLDPDSPGAMPEGSFLMSLDTFPTVDELREILPAGVFEHSLDGAATAAYVYLTFVSESYADLDRPADTSVINAMAGESCGWCANHIQRVHSLAGANVRVTDYTLTDSALGQFAAGEVEAGDVVVEAPIRVGATKVWNPDGTLNTSFPESDVLFRLQLRYYDGMWHVMGIQEQPL